jgi:DNA-binding CsgD family transcriptional regulator
LVEDGGTPQARIRRLVVANSGRGEAEEHLARELTCHYPLDPTSPHGTPKVLRTGRPELIPEVRDELLRDCDGEYLRWMRDLTPSSYLCVPLQVGVCLVGSVGFVFSAAHSGRRYGPEDLILAESLARCTALVVANILKGTPGPANHRQKVIPSTTPGREPELNPRQLEVLRLLDSGMRVHQIKAELRLSEPTVRTHVRAILRAFGACSRLEALHKARVLGFIGGMSQNAESDRSR